MIKTLSSIPSPVPPRMNPKPGIEILDIFCAPASKLYLQGPSLANMMVAKLMKYPFEGLFSKTSVKKVETDHPYRSGLNEQEKKEMLQRHKKDELEVLQRQLADRLRRIIETISQPQGIIPLSSEDANFGNTIRKLLNFKTHRLYNDGAGETLSYQITIDYKSLASALGIPLEAAKFLQLFSKEELFRLRTFKESLKS